MAQAGSAGGDGSAAETTPESSPAKPSASSRIAKNSFWLIAQPLLMNAISLFQIAYIARGLGKTDYGRLVFALSFTTMFVPLSNLGLRFLTVRHIASSDKKDLADYIGKVTTVRFALALLGAGLSALIVALINKSPETKQIVHLASAIIVLQAMITTVTDVFQGYETMRLDAQVRFTSGMVITVLSVVALYLGYGLVGVMATYVFGNFVGAVLAFYYLFTRFTVPKFKLDLRFAKENLVKAVPFFFPALVGHVGGKMGVVILAAMVGEAAVGIYGAASTLVEKLAIIPDGVCSALFPTMAAVYATSRPEAGALFRKFFGYFVIFGLPLAVGTGLVAGPIITLIYGKAYQGSPLVLTLLVWGLFLHLFYQLQYWTVNATHQERRAFFMPIIATAVYLVASVVLVWKFKETGLAVAGIVLEIVNFILFTAVIRATLTPRSIEPGILWKVLLATAVMAGAVYPVRGLSIFISIPAAAIVYGAMVVALKIVPREDLTAMTKLVRKRMRRSRPAPADNAPAAG